MRANPEFELCKAISTYLRLQYPKVLFHWDLAGLNLSRAQAGMMKSIQGKRGFPDLFIVEPTKIHSGLFIEVKKEGVKLFKRDSSYTTDHIQEQADYIDQLQMRGYCATFGIGFEDCKIIIDNYLQRTN